MLRPFRGTPGYPIAGVSLATVVVPSKWPDIFEGCRSNLGRYIPGASKILVRDGDAIDPPEGWTTLQGSKPFCYARNVNLGIQACDTDVLLLNDDCQFSQTGVLHTLGSVFLRHPDISILSPNVDGVANGVFQAVLPVEETNHFLSFVCVLIRRAVFDKIGLLDERYTGYGVEDVDFCRRAQAAGFKLAITSMVTVSHKQASSSFSREPDKEKKYELARRLYVEKWGSRTQGCYSDES